MIINIPFTEVKVNPECPDCKSTDLFILTINLFHQGMGEDWLLTLDVICNNCETFHTVDTLINVGKPVLNVG